MAIDTRSITAEQLEALPEDDQNRELVFGEVVAEMPPGFEHSVIALRIATHFLLYLVAHPIGEAAVEGGYILRRDPDTVRAPDAAVILHSSRKFTELPRTFLQGAPDLVVEVVSPNDSAMSVSDKVADWLEGGAQLVWVVYPTRPRLVAHYADGHAHTYELNDQIDAMPVLPGFTFLLRELLQPPQR